MYLIRVLFSPQRKLPMRAGVKSFLSAHWWKKRKDGGICLKDRMYCTVHITVIHGCVPPPPPHPVSLAFTSRRINEISIPNYLYASIRELLLVGADITLEKILLEKKNFVICYPIETHPLYSPTNHHRSSAGSRGNTFPLKPGFPLYKYLPLPISSLAR